MIRADLKLQLQKAAIAVSLLLFLGALAACQQGGENPSFIRIYGGMPVSDSGFAATVAIGLADEPHPFCTGVMVSPLAVLTAGHCLGLQSRIDEYGPNVSPFDPSELRVYVANSLQKAEAKDVFRVASATAHPLLRASPMGYADFGLLVLSEPVAGVTPLPLVLTNAERISAFNRGQVTLVGFGSRESAKSGVKYAVTTKLRELNPAEVVVGGSGEDACTGDSGGPALVVDRSGQLKILGIISRGVHLECGAGTVTELSGGAACWLSEQIALTGGPSDVADLASFCPKESRRYSDQELEKSNFAQLCGSPSATVDQAETVASVMLALGASSCDVAVTKLEASNHLNLDGLKLVDLSPLASLKHLRHLSLKANRLLEISSLRLLKNLVSLEVDGNDIRDSSSLAALVKNGLKIRGLRRQLWNHQDTNFRRQCRALKAGSIDHQSELTVRALLWHASSDDCDIANARLLMRTTLNLSGRGLTDLAPLADFTRLEHLDLRDNPLTDIAHLVNLENLDSLDLRDTNVVETTVLAGLIEQGLQIWR